MSHVFEEMYIKDIYPCPVCGAPGARYIQGDSYRYRVLACVGCEFQLEQRIDTMTPLSEKSQVEKEHKCVILLVQEWNTTVLGNRWYRALSEELASIYYYTDFNPFSNPKEAIRKIISWHVTAGLDRRISQEAQNLYDEAYLTGVNDAERKAEEQKKLE